MIKSNITVEVNSTELDGVLIVPSAVFTSTVQEEELDLTKTPNFQIVIGKGDEINDTVEVSFTAEEVEYTANMKVVNRNRSTVTLQYVDGLTSEDAPEPEPEKSEAPTISYDNTNFTVSASGQGTVKMYVDGVETVSPHTFTQGETDVTYVVTATAQQDGKAISDTVTENCLVPAASQPEPEQTTYYVRGYVNETNSDTFIPIIEQVPGYDSVIIQLSPTEGAGSNSGRFYITSSNDPETWQQHCLGVDGSNYLTPETDGTEYQLTEGYQTRFQINDGSYELELFRDTLIATFSG